MFSSIHFDSVFEFLKSFDMETYIPQFQKNGLMDSIEMLKSLNENDLSELGITKIGQIKIFEALKSDLIIFPKTYESVLSDLLSKSGLLHLSSLLKNNALLDVRTFSLINEDDMKNIGILSIADRKKLSVLKENVNNEIYYITALELVALDNEDDLKSANEIFKNLGDFRDSIEKTNECEASLKLIKEYNNAEVLLNSNVQSDLEKAESFYSKNLNFKDCSQKYEECKKKIENIKKEDFLKLDKEYNEAEILATSLIVYKIESAARFYYSHLDYKDCSKKYHECIEKIAKIKEKDRLLREEERENKRKSKCVKNTIIILCILLIIGFISNLLNLSCKHHSDKSLITEATCTKPSMCTLCNEEISKALDHNFVKKSEDINLCTINTTYECSYCNELKTDKSFKHSYVEISKIASTCFKEGLIVLKCSVCGYEKRDTMAKSSHTYKDYICTICGYEDPPNIPRGNSLVDYLLPIDASYEKDKDELRVLFTLSDNHKNFIMSDCRVKIRIIDEKGNEIYKGIKLLTKNDGGMYSNSMGNIFEAMEFKIHNLNLKKYSSYDVYFTVEAGSFKFEEADLSFFIF